MSSKSSSKSKSKTGSKSTSKSRSKSFKTTDEFVEFTFPDTKRKLGIVLKGTYPIINKIDIIIFFFRKQYINTPKRIFFLSNIS